MPVISAEKFIDRCKDKFGWSDLSRDYIMVVGCGEEGLCAKAILEKFPEIRAIVGIDKDPKVARNFLQRTAMKECAIADIERRETLRNYEGRITKVISTHVFEQLMEIEAAFRNVYHVLRPGGEAAVLFSVKNLAFTWLSEIMKKPKWKAFFKRYFREELCRVGFGEDQYKQMVEKIGFKVVDCIEEKRVTLYESDEDIKEKFYKSWVEYFSVPSELHEEFNEEGFEVLLKLIERDDEGRLCYVRTDLGLLISKPTESSRSKTKAKIGF